jgi:hypothetical protein
LKEEGKAGGKKINSFILVSNSHFNEKAIGRPVERIFFLIMDSKKQKSCVSDLTKPAKEKGF